MRILGLDISTTCVGYAIVDEHSNLDSIGYIEIPKDLSLFKKAVYVLSSLKERNAFVDIDEVAIEEALKMFLEGKSSAQTISTLSQFNGMLVGLVCFILNKQPNYYNVATARSKAKLGVKFQKGCNRKQEIQKRFVSLYPDIEWTYKRTGPVKDGWLDACDALVIARGHANSLK